MPLYGGDFSIYQPHIPAIETMDFVIVKASQRDFTDPTYEDHAAAVREAGKFLVAYHFGEDFDVGTQVNTFLGIASRADAWVLDRDPTYVGQDGTKHPQITPSQCRDFIRSVQLTGRKCGLYFNCANYLDAGQDWNWQASPPNLCPDIPWDIYQHASGQPRGDFTNHDTLAFFGEALGVRQFTVTQDEPHLLHVPAGTRVYDMGGAYQRVTQEGKDQPGLVRGKLGTSDAVYWVVPLQLSGDKQLALIREGDATDKGKLTQGGGGGGGHSGTYNDGYAAAKTAALNAVKAL